MKINCSLSPFPSSKVGKFSLNCLMAVSIAVLTGCGPVASTGSSVPLMASLSGRLSSGGQAVVDAQVQLYASGERGAGSAASALLAQPVKTLADGSFAIKSAVSCPANDSKVYVLARGGSAVEGSASQNQSLALMSVLGDCGQLASPATVVVNEATTVGSVWPLASYLASPTELGSAFDDADFVTAVAQVGQLVDAHTGSIASGSESEDAARLATLANALAACGTANGCEQLFALATPVGGKAPTDTITAALRIAQNPAQNVAELFNLASTKTTFQPALQQAPGDWTIGKSAVAGTNNASGKAATSGAGAAALLGSIANDIASLGTITNHPAFAYTAQTTTAKTTTVAAIDSSLFGMSVLNYSQLVPPMQLGTTRTWDGESNLDWAEANPTKGQYVFYWIDQFIALNQARGTQIVYTLGRTPVWASSNASKAGPYGVGECAPPTNISDWDNYLTALATHAKGKIKYYELWNEPDDPNFYCGDIPTMVTMAQHAKTIIKGIDPTALILSPAVTGGPGPAWLSTFLADGGAAAVDVIAFHGYWSTQAEDIATVVASYKTVMTANGVGNLPMWDTESSWSGFGNNGTPTVTNQVSYVAKSYLMHYAQGVSRFIWYAYDGGPIWGGMYTPATGPSTAAAAYAETEKWMIGATMPSGCSKSTGQIWTCVLTRPNGYAAEAIWLGNTGTANIAIPSQYTMYRDLTGTEYPVVKGRLTISNQPYLLESGSLNPLAAPTITPAAGSYEMGQAVTIAESSPNSVVHYSTDGSTPTAASPVYTAPFALMANQTVRAIAISGSSNSTVTSNSFVVKAGTLVFKAQPATVIAGVTIAAAPAVSVVDANGNTLTGVSTPVTLAVSGGPANKLTGTTTVNLVQGAASFPGLIIPMPGSGYKFVATAAQVGTATGSAFTVTPATYYVANSGNDANDGLSPATAWKTIGKVNASTALFVPGTSILLNRGDVFRDDYINLENTVVSTPTNGVTLANAPPAISGTAASPITIGAYGTGANPLLDGADPLSVQWTKVNSTTWQATVSQMPGKLYVDSPTAETQQLVPQPNAVGAWQANTAYHYLDLVTQNGINYIQYGVNGAAGASNLGSQLNFVSVTNPAAGNTSQAFSSTASGIANVQATPGSWYGSGSTIYVHLADESDPNQHLIEGTHRNFGVLAMSLNYLVVQNLSVERTQKGGIVAGTYTDSSRGYSTNNYNTIQNNSVWNWGDIGRTCLPQQQGCTGATQAAIQSKGFVSGSSAGAAVTGTTIAHNTVGRSDQYFAIRGTAMVAGVEAVGQTGAVIQYNSIATINNQCLNYTSADNEALNTGGDIGYNYCGNNQGNYFVANTTGARIHHNVAANSFGEGIQIGGYDAQDMIDHNLLYNLGKNASTVGYNGIDCNGYANNITEANNTIVNVNSASITLETGCNNMTIENNILAQPQGISTSNFYYWLPTQSTGEVFRNNLYSFTTQAHPWGYNFQLSDWMAFSGETNAQQANPAFVNPSIGDYRLQNGSLGTAMAASVSGITTNTQVGANLAAPQQ